MSSRPKLKIAEVADNYHDCKIDSFFYKLVIAEVLGYDLSPNEFLLMAYIVNQTIGHRDRISGEPKKWDFIAQSVFQRLLGAKEETTTRDLKKLETMRLIMVYRDPSRRREMTTARFNAYSIGDEIIAQVEEIYMETTGHN